MNNLLYQELKKLFTSLLEQNECFIKYYELFNRTNTLNALQIEIYYTNGDFQVLSTRPVLNNNLYIKSEEEFYNIVKYLKNSDLLRLKNYTL